MKRFSILVSLAAAAVIFTGCGGGGGGGGVAPAPGPQLAVLYLDGWDGDIVPQPGVYYACDTGDGWTDAEGGFYYYPGEDCTFDLSGYPGSWTYPLYIDYENGDGAGGIGYDCWSGTGGWTEGNGEFYYGANDSCTFYL